MFLQGVTDPSYNMHGTEESSESTPRMHACTYARMHVCTYARRMSIILSTLEAVLKEEPTSFVVLPTLCPSPGMTLLGTFLFFGERLSEAFKATTTSVDGSRSLISESGNSNYDICTCLVFAFYIESPASGIYTHLLA